MSDTKKPLYARIVDVLKKEIRSGSYKPGELLPTEEELSKQFGASRTTIRNAVGELEKESLVWRRQGKGTIVKDPKTAQNLNYLSSLSECLEERGLEITTGLLSISLAVPPPIVREELDLSEGVKVFRLQRTKIADGVPVAYINNYLLADSVPGLDQKIDFLKNRGLYQVLEAEYGLELHSCVETINVYLSGPLEAEMLQLVKTTPLFLSKRTTRLADGTLFEYVTSVIRGDIHQYTVFLTNRKPADGI